MEKKKILWVEDDHYHLKGLTIPLEKDGFEIIVAKCYMDTKRMLEEHKDLNLIILDLIIPYTLSGDKIEQLKINNSDSVEKATDLVKNGVKIFNFIRTELKLEIPIIILTIVQNNNIINKLLDDNNPGVNKKYDKFGTLPQDLKNIVLELLP